MYQAGTLSGNPLAMTAGLATLRVLCEPGVFAGVDESTSSLVAGIEAAAAQAGMPIQAGQAGTMFGFYFLNTPGAAITQLCRGQAASPTRRAIARFFHAMLERGVYFAPSQFEAGFHEHGARPTR